MLPSVTIDDINTAADRIRGVVSQTPLLWSAEIDALVGGRVLIKAECLQQTGAFKLRGAFNAILQLTDEQRQNGVVAWSSGNHAQAVAMAARTVGSPATIVMPADAPGVKIANTRALGASVVLYDRTTESREDIGQTIAAQTGAAIIPPFDHPAIIAGQGTAGLEAVHQTAALGLNIDNVIAPASGGGLIAGAATAVKAAFPEALAYCAEPQGFDDIAQSLTAGRITPNSRVGGSICDALLARQPGTITFPLLKALLAGGATVNDTECLRAMRTAFDRLRIVLEPGGAAALAAVLARRIPTQGRVTLVIASGGNVDPATFARALEQRPYA